MPGLGCIRCKRFCRGMFSEHGVAAFAVKGCISDSSMLSNVAASWLLTSQCMRPQPTAITFLLSFSVLHTQSCHMHRDARSFHHQGMLLLVACCIIMQVLGSYAWTCMSICVSFQLTAQLPAQVPDLLGPSSQSPSVRQAGGALLPTLDPPGEAWVPRQGACGAAVLEGVQGVPREAHTSPPWGLVGATSTHHAMHGRTLTWMHPRISGLCSTMVTCSL